MMDAIDFAAQLAAMRTESQIVEALVAFLEPYGLQGIAIARMPSPDHPYPDGFLVSNWPPIWKEMYFEKEFGPHDPVSRALGVITAPMTLSEIRAGKAGFLPDAKGEEILQAGADLGFKCSIAIPVFGAHGYRGLACFSGKGPEPDARGRIELNVVAVAAHNRLLELYLSRNAEESGELTQRELQVLAALRAGLRDEAVGMSLGISKRTVRFHVENARRKLGCRTRSEAVARAISMRLI